MNVSFSRIIAFLEWARLQQHDTFLMVDGISSYPWGPVGLGKSNLARIICYALNGNDFDLHKNMVVRDDLEGFAHIVYNKTPDFVKLLDEAQYWLSRQYWNSRWVKPFTPLIESDRKDFGVWVVVCPRMQRLVPIISEEGRVTIRFLMESKTTCNVWMNDGTFDWDYNRYGRQIARVTDIPLSPDTEEYDSMYSEHSCIERGEKCLSNLISI